MDYKAAGGSARRGVRDWREENGKKGGVRGERNSEEDRGRRERERERGWRESGKGAGVTEGQLVK